MSTTTEQLKEIGWEEGWERDFSVVRRVKDVSKITVKIVLCLAQIFNLLEFYDFLVHLVPPDFVLPSYDVVRRNLQKTKAAKTKIVKCHRKGSFEYDSFMESKFFFASSESVSPAPSSARQGGAGCECEPKLKRLKLQKETLELNIEKARYSELEVKFNKLKLELLNVKQQLGGTRSALSKKVHQDKSLPNPPVTPPSSSKHDHFISVTLESADYPDLFEGISYDSGKKQVSSGKSSVFVRIGSKTSNSALSNKQLNRRATFAMRVLAVISGCAISTPSDTGNKEVQLLLSRMIRSNPSLFDRAAANVGMYFSRMLTVSEAVNLRSLLRMPMSLFRSLRTVLCNMGIKILPSEPRMRKAQQLLTQHVDRRSIIVESMTLRLAGKEVKVGSLPVLHCTNLTTYITNVFLDLKGRCSAFSNPDTDIWLLFSGDKGGSLMKFHFEIVNCGGSVFDVHIFSMYEASDCIGNMTRVLSRYRQEIHDMQTQDFRIDGRKVKVFLGGDFHFLDGVLGHQGSSASFPSAKDHVSLDHLRNHPPTPHTPSHCEITLRTVQEYEENFMENLCEDPKGGDIHKTGKHHFSVVGRSIFPIASLENVVPPVLHITLGIVLKLYNMLLAQVQQLDGEELTAIQCQERSVIDREWREASKKLKEKECDVKKYGCAFIDLCNFRDRFFAVRSGDLAMNTTIAKQSDDSRKRAKKQEKCASLLCCISDFDSNVFWVKCDSCEKWMHGLCEGLSSTEEQDLNSRANYSCLACSGILLQTFEDYLESKFVVIRTRQTEVESEVVALSDRCSRFQFDAEEAMGPLEQHLLNLLDQIKVVRQAFHGDIFVGNHCKIILRNHELLCSVLYTRPEVKAKFVEIFSIFAEVQPLILRKKILTDDEISEVIRLCTRYGERFPLLFPDSNITRKMHELIFDVPRFLALHKTLGMFSEEEGESLHNSINQELCQVASVRDPSMKLHLLLERQELRGKADRSLFNKKARLCQVCSNNGRRIFLKNDICSYCSV